MGSVCVRVLLKRVCFVMSGLNYKGRQLSMQRNESPAYPGRPVAGILPEVSWVPDPNRSNSGLNFELASEQCSRTAAPAAENPSKISRSVYRSYKL